MKQNARKSSKVSAISAESRLQLQEWLKADYQLYNHFVQRLDTLIDR